AERQRAGAGENDNAEFREIAISLLEAGLAKRLIDLFPQWEMLADLGREKQREWCLYMERYLRKILLVSQGLADLADPAPEEEATLRGFAARIRPTFYEKAFAALEEAIASIGSNVNPKLVFCDLSNRLLLAL
ncbi:MAG: hypothetical protein II665_03435, partial [Bacteroidales bacterium]|nr:hypothetical protein [Bacteroidales bacterium]